MYSSRTCIKWPERKVHNRYRCLWFLPSYVCHSSVRCLLLCPLDVSGVQSIPIASFFRHGFRWRRSTKSSVWVWRRWEIPLASPWLGLLPFHPTTTSVLSTSECDVQGGGRPADDIACSVIWMSSLDKVFWICDRLLQNEEKVAQNSTLCEVLRNYHTDLCHASTSWLIELLQGNWSKPHLVLIWSVESFWYLCTICSVKMFWYLCIILECFIVPSPILTCKWIETAFFLKWPKCTLTRML